MAEDTKMTDEAPEKGQEKKEVEVETKPPAPPLEAAAQRLDRLLGGSVGAKDKDQVLHSYTNPAKVVRRWLGTSSGAAADANADDIKAAATNLLDPKGPCKAGRALLVSNESSKAMEVDNDAEKKVLYLSMASAREVESWLISLAVRLLWRQKKFAEAFDLALKGIAILMSHLEEASLKITSASAASASSLFPLLARMFRLRSLVAESLNDASIHASLRIDMTKAHNMASLRRDVDSQATLLNCMLRDLLRNSQGRYHWRDASKSRRCCAFPRH